MPSSISSKANQIRVSGGESGGGVGGGGGDRCGERKIQEEKAVSELVFN